MGYISGQPRHVNAPFQLLFTLWCGSQLMPPKMWHISLILNYWLICGQLGGSIFISLKGQLDSICQLWLFITQDKLHF